MRPVSEQDIEKIISLIEGKLSDQEALQVRASIESDPVLAQEYRQQKRVSALLKDLLQAEPAPVPCPEKEYWSGIQKKIHQQAAPQKAEKMEWWKRMAQIRRVWAPALAACLVVSWVFIYQAGLSQQALPMGYSEVETGNGVSSTTLESDTICIELITSIYTDPIGS